MRKTPSLQSVSTKQKRIAELAVLEAIYEQDFLDCSYGFRPGRWAHDALESLWQWAMRWRGGWVLEADIESFFDSVDRRQLLANVYLHEVLDVRKAPTGQRPALSLVRRLG